MRVWLRRVLASQHAELINNHKRAVCTRPTGLLAAQQLQQQRRQPSLAAAAQRRRGTHARPGRSSALGVMSYHHDELGSSSDRSKRMEDADRRSVASAARSRENPGEWVGRWVA